MYQLIDGKKISNQIKEELKEKVEELKNEGKSNCLAVIQVGNDPSFLFIHAVEILNNHEVTNM